MKGNIIIDEVIGHNLVVNQGINGILRGVHRDIHGKIIDEAIGHNKEEPINLFGRQGGDGEENAQSPVGIGHFACELSDTLNLSEGLANQLIGVLSDTILISGF